MKRLLIATAIVFAPLAHAYSQAPATPQQSNQIEDSLALQLGRYQLAIAKQNSMIQDLMKQNKELREKCGEPCKSEEPKPDDAGGDPNATQTRPE